MFTEQDFLTVSGEKIINRSGKEIILKGTNLGGWLHREGWMDGCGACLLPVPFAGKEQTPEGLVIRLEKISRVNRIVFSRLPQMSDALSPDFRIEASLDGITWKTRAEGCFSDTGISRLENGRPVPYIPGVNTYDEGTFVQGNVIHTNEFFAQYLRISGVADAFPKRYGDIDDFSARRILSERFGEEKAEELLTAYQAAYITEADLVYLKSLGFNLVRLPLYWQEIMTADGHIKADAWDEIDRLIGWCRELNMYVLLDYHGAPGGNTLGSITSGQLDSNALWTEPLYQDMSCRIWQAISRRYRNEPTVAGYDLLNEPSCVPPAFDDTPVEASVEKNASATLYFHMPDLIRKPVQDLYRRFYDELRGDGETHILCMQQFADLELIPQPAEYGWENVMYQVHCYPLGDFRDHDQVAVSMHDYAAELGTFKEKWGIPALAGEFCCWGFADVWNRWLDDLNRMGFHWTSWSYKIIDPNPGDNWSLWYGFDGEFVKYDQDDYETILRKYRSFSTGHYKKNEALEEMLKKGI